MEHLQKDFGIICNLGLKIIEIFYEELSMSLFIETMGIISGSLRPCDCHFISRITAASYDKTLRVWDIETGKLLVSAVTGSVPRTWQFTPPEQMIQETARRNPSCTHDLVTHCHFCLMLFIRSEPLSLAHAHGVEN